MAMTIVYKSKSSNQTKTPINNSMTLRLDKLTVLLDPADSDKADIHNSLFSALKTSERFKSWPKGGYKISGKLSFEKSTRTVFIQAEPNDTTKPYLRFELNPSKLGLDGLNEFHSDLITFVPNGFGYLLEHGRVSRIDIAVDLAMSELGITMDDFHFLPMTGLTRRDFGVDGHLETIYLGSPKGNQWRIYRKDVEQKAVKNRIIPATIRVERVLRKPGKLQLSALSALDNPFLATRLIHEVPPKPAWEKIKPWLQFQDSVKCRGITPALQLLSSDKRKKYRAYLNQNAKPWWEPADVWKHWNAVLTELSFVGKSAFK